MSDHIKKASRTEPNRLTSTERSENDRKSHEVKLRKKTDNLSVQQETDTLAHAPRHAAKLPVMSPPEISKGRVSFQTPIKTAGRKRVHSPESDSKIPTTKFGSDIETKTSELQAGQTSRTEKSKPSIQGKLQKEYSKFIEQDSNRKYEKWDQYPLVRMLDTGRCPYSPDRPLLWSKSQKYKAHRKHVNETRPNNTKPEEYTGENYTEYAVSVLRKPVSKSFPAFFSLERTARRPEHDKTKPTPFITKVYRLDKERGNIAIGDARGRIITCFRPDCKSLDDWFMEKLEDARSLEGNLDRS